MNNVDLTPTLIAQILRDVRARAEAGDTAGAIDLLDKVIDALEEEDPGVVVGDDGTIMWSRKTCMQASS